MSNCTVQGAHPGWFEQHEFLLETAWAAKSDAGGPKQPELVELLREQRWVKFRWWNSGFNLKASWLCHFKPTPKAQHIRGPKNQAKTLRNQASTTRWEATLTDWLVALIFRGFSSNLIFHLIMFVFEQKHWKIRLFDLTFGELFVCEELKETVSLLVELACCFDKHLGPLGRSECSESAHQPFKGPFWIIGGWSGSWWFFLLFPVSTLGPEWIATSWTVVSLLVFWRPSWRRVYKKILTFICSSFRHFKKSWNFNVFSKWHCEVDGYTRLNQGVKKLSSIHWWCGSGSRLIDIIFRLFSVLI